jgi:hypothetical protein
MPTRPLTDSGDNKQRKIKLVWDFYGPDSKGTAEHHVRHLKQFMNVESKSYFETGVDGTLDFHFLAFLVVTEADVVFLRDKLKPHRAFVVE